LTVTGVSVVTLAGRAGTATSARALVGLSLRLAGRSATTTGARADLTVAALVTVVPPGAYATFRDRVATALEGATAPSSDVYATFRDRVAVALTGATGPAEVFSMFREAITAALTVNDDPVEVHSGPVDSLTPPAYMLQWADPWSTPATACHELATLEIICIAGRIEPDPGIETLEVMVAAALAALQVAGIPHGPTSAPRLFEVAGVPYLSARITVSGTVNIGAN
jgi:hypothetical protein